MSFKHLWFMPLLAVLMTGCGGGGSSSGSSGGPGGGAGVAAPLYATDAPNPSFRNVWVTLYSISLVNSSGGTVQAFSSSAGVTVDVRSLRDANGQLFEFLNAASVPAGTYTGAQIDVSNTVTIVPAGGITSTAYTFVGANSGGTGMTQLTTTFSPTFTANGTNPVVLDFNLDKWSINASGQVSATVQFDYAANVDASGRQIDRPISGKVQNLSGTAGSQTFDLVHDGNQILQVTTTSSTTITNENGAADPALADGDPVFLTGMVANGAFTADAISIINATAVATPIVHTAGTATNINSTAGTFSLTIQQCDRAMTSVVASVVTNTSTKFFSDGVTETEADFFTQLAAAPSGTTVEVDGTLATGTATLTATDVNLNIPVMGGGGGGGGTTTHLVLAGGQTSNLNATAGTFTLTVAQWMGQDLKKGATVSVVTNSSTYFNLNGKTATQANWFAGLTATTDVVAIGSLSNGTLTAEALVIGNNSNGLGHPQGTP